MATRWEFYIVHEDQGYAASAAHAAFDDVARLEVAVNDDAPPTGRLSKYLNVNSEISGLAKVGPGANVLRHT